MEQVIEQIALAKAEGWITRTVSVRHATHEESDLGLHLVHEEDGSCTVVIGEVPGDFLPASELRRAEVAEFVIVHELGHCVHESLGRFFDAPALRPSDNSRISDFLLMRPDSISSMRFREMFADAFAASVVLGRSRGSHAQADRARALVRELAVRRLQASEDGIEELDAHRTHQALLNVLNSVDGSGSTERASNSVPVRSEEILSHAMSAAGAAFVLDLKQGSLSEPELDASPLESRYYAYWTWSACSESSSFPLARQVRIASRISIPGMAERVSKTCSVMKQTRGEPLRRHLDEMAAEIERSNPARFDRLHAPSPSAL
jgi:hypothetical protein